MDGNAGGSKRLQTDQQSRRRRVVGEILRGCVGGCIATVVMTVYRLPIFNGLPPTAEFWARYVGGGDADQYFVQGLVLHFLYGTVAGGAYGLLHSRFHESNPMSREVVSVLSGLLYGLSLSVFGSRVLFVRVLGRELRAEDALVFHVGHVIYGLTLGTWMGDRERYGEVYDDSKQTRPETARQRTYSTSLYASSVSFTSDSVWA
jgi:hypothetical protein